MLRSHRVVEVEHFAHSAAVATAAIFRLSAMAGNQPAVAETEDGKETEVLSLGLPSELSYMTGNLLTQVPETTAEVAEEEDQTAVAA